MHLDHRRYSAGFTILILLAGFTVRLALHDYHGLEGDDGFSLALSRFPVEELVPGLMSLSLDIHPPLHFLALKGWRALAGDSLLALRLMNVLADLLTGALLIRFAGRAFGWRAGLAAGLLWLSAPLPIYATYLLRMYTLLGTFVAAGAVCTFELIHTRRARWAAGLLLVTVAALYTQVVALVAAGAYGLALAAALLRGNRAAWPGIVALAGAGVLFLPFALPVLEVYQSGRVLGATVNTSQFSSPSEIPGTVMAVLLGHRVLLPALWWAAALAASGLLLARVRGRAVTPLALGWGALLGLIALAAIDFYKPRYLAPFTPLVLALLAGAVMQVRMRAARGLLLTGMIALGMWGVMADLDRSTRDDWAAAAKFVETYDYPGDAVVVIPDWGQEAFKFHYRGSAPVTGIFPRLTEEVAYAPILEGLAAGHDGVWLVRYQPEVSDPDGLADAWFRDRAVLATEVYPAGMQVKYYDLTPVHAALPVEARELDARFGEQLALRGVFLPETSGAARDTRLHPPSNWVRVTLYWEALTPGTTLTPQVRITDSFGQVYGAALTRESGLFTRYPPTTWRRGEIYEAAYDLNLNPDMPPGSYNIEVMALDEGGQPVASAGADTGANWVIAGQFQVR